jgi:alpha- and gamma-adaptin-binding protein p34
MLNLKRIEQFFFFAGLSVYGDVQGVERLFGALSAHMWPGMILKSGNRIPAPFLLEKEGYTIFLC